MEYGKGGTAASGTPVRTSFSNFLYGLWSSHFLVVQWELHKEVTMIPGALCPTPTMEFCA